MLVSSCSLLMLWHFPFHYTGVVTVAWVSLDWLDDQLREHPSFREIPEEAIKKNVLNFQNLALL